MKRFTLVAAILSLGFALSACDKCGNSVPLFGTGSTSCGGSTPAK